jgi:MFS family permease
LTAVEVGGVKPARVFGGLISSRWAFVALLTLVGVLNYLDREMPYILTQSIKHDLRLSDGALGFINGIGFLLIYALVGIPISRLSDRGVYGLVISASILFWSAMTALGGFAANGWQLALTRMGVAIGEAGSTPAAHAFITSRFELGRRGAALAMVSMAAPIGSTLGLMIGGLLNDALGWRAAFWIMGLPGVFLAIVVALTVKAPPRAEISARPASGPILRDALTLLRIPTFRRTVLAASVLAIGTNAQVVFSPAFLARTHHMSASEIGLRFGLVKGVLGVTGLIIAGVLCDRLSQRDVRWMLWLTAIAVTAVLPFTATAFLAGPTWISVSCIALANAVGLFYLGPTFSTIQTLAPPHLRALASAMLLFGVSTIGGVGPPLAGMVSDALHGSMGEASLGRALLFVPVMQLIGVGLFLFAAVDFRRDAEVTRAALDLP